MHMVPKLLNFSASRPFRSSTRCLALINHIFPHVLPLMIDLLDGFEREQRSLVNVQLLLRRSIRRQMTSNAVVMHRSSEHVPRGVVAEVR